MPNSPQRYSLALPIMVFPGAQMMVLMYPVFQNRYFGSKFAQVTTMSYLFTIPLSRATIYWGKATIYCIGSIIFPVVFLLGSYLHPDLSIEFPYTNLAKPEIRRDFYESAFSGASFVSTGDKSVSVYLPNGQIALAGAWLTVTIASALLYQAVLSAFRSETRLQFILQNVLGISLIFILIFGSGLIFRTISWLDRLAAFMSCYSWPVYLLLGLLTVVVQGFCSRRFVSREVL